MRVSVLISVIGLGLFGVIGTASAGDGDYDRERTYHSRHRQARLHSRERLTRDQREFERTRAENYDPTGSYAAYPDWARYALSPKNGNR